MIDEVPGHWDLTRYLLNDLPRNGLAIEDWRAMNMNVGCNWFCHYKGIGCLSYITRLGDSVDDDKEFIKWVSWEIIVQRSSCLLLQHRRLHHHDQINRHVVEICWMRMHFNLNLCFNWRPWGECERQIICYLGKSKIQNVKKLFDFWVCNYYNYSITY